MKIYIGNLNYETTDAELKALFQEYGEVASLIVCTWRETGKPRGYGFCSMPNDAEANAAIAGLNGKEVGGRTLRVAEAHNQD